MKVFEVPVMGWLEYLDLGHTDCDEDIKCLQLASTVQTECIYIECGYSQMTTGEKTGFKASSAASALTHIVLTLKFVFRAAYDENYSVKPVVMD
jgi:hypothetical protein